ncbi:nucleotide sugar dehydrogenase [Brenneria goodwinii]|uniref:nucleotide sugar dehydrogenase n=1 Tax=Brenneria goodwinii TaxID=1109412 RepID=UPI0036F0BF23
MNIINGIAIIGMGYVGLPLALEFGKKFKTIGFDLNLQRIEQLRDNLDINGEHNIEEFREANHLTFSGSLNDIAGYDFFIITVPTPVTADNSPDFRPLLIASEMIGGILHPGSTVIYESTVYPGATEEICVPMLEKSSGLEFNKDFFVGYSPERINPGDKKNKLKDICKITSGSTIDASRIINQLYNTIIAAGTHMAESIKVAEAAKVIENIQRDVNIALMNELSIIFRKMDIDTYAVLEAAATKWNFSKFVPGLVGGHCIGVDPYYLIMKAEAIGIEPKLISYARNTNENMVPYVIENVINGIRDAKKEPQESRILILGITFKENCSDIRNSKVIDIYSGLKKYNIAIDIYDPVANKIEMKVKHNIELINKIECNKYDSVIFCVPHDEIINIAYHIVETTLLPGGKVFDLKNILSSDQSHFRF